ncbi:MAG: DUF4124 domain-containing protein [Burkholderiaceae bacterium]|nr:DUF4124 domain-containing protein [Burkholderiaceae bacterium]
MTTVRAHLIFALLGLALCQPAAAQWKWRDAEGKVQYSDRPPPSGVADKDILQQPASATKRIQVISTVPLGGAASAPAEAAPKPKVETKADAELEARRRKAEQEQQAKAKADEQKNVQIKQENCSQARSYLRTLEDGMRVSRTNDKGEREILDDKQRAAEIQRARGVMNNDCAKPQ